MPAESQVIEDDSRTRIILDLSSKVSEQDDRIIQLELKLREKDKLIEELRGKSQTANRRNQPSVPALVTEGASGSGSAKQPAWADSEDDNATTEMQQIQREMRKLHSARQKKKKKRVNEAPDFQRSSATSRDSGIVPHVEEDCNQNESKRLAFGAGTLYSEEESSGDARENAGESLAGRGDSHSGSGQTSLDPSSIRQISAARNRRSPRTDSFKTKSARTLPVLTRQHDDSLNDADTLLKTIDDDVHSFRTSKPALTSVSVLS